MTSSQAFPLSGKRTGRSWCYELEDSPFVMAMGQLVNDQQLPFVWLPGELPFHVLRPDLLPYRQK